MRVAYPSVLNPIVPTGRHEPHDEAPLDGSVRQSPREQQVASSKVPLSADARRAAENVAEGYYRDSVYVASQGASRRAIASYDSVARHIELEYVSSVLGIDEFA